MACAWNSGSAAAWATAFTRRSRTSAGSPLGAAMPRSEDSTKSKPCSLPVGRSGASIERPGENWPMLRSGSPPRIACSASPTLIAATMICREASAVRTSAEPLNGTCVIVTPAIRSNYQHRQVVIRADARRADRRLAGIRARESGKIVQGADVGLGVHRKVARVVDDVADEVEAGCLELRLALDRDRHGRRRVDEADGVAVRRRVGERREAHLAARAGAVDDHDLRDAAEILL